MTIVQNVSSVIMPVIDALGVELVDVEHRGVVVRVVVDEPGGISLDRLFEVTQQVSRVLDEADPISARYTLEVSSPGVERPLRTPRHFAAVLGQKITFRWTRDPKTERLTGILLSADDNGITVRTEPVKAADEPETLEIGYRAIDKARTVFEWGPGPKPGRGSKPGAAKASKARSATAKNEMTMAGDQP